jgi:YggT family protein
MDVVGAVLLWVLWPFFLCLLFRFVMSLVLQFARSWEPHGVMLVVVETAFTVTDPPLKLLRRYIPPLRLGGMALDLAFMILGIIVYLLISVANGL